MKSVLLIICTLMLASGLHIRPPYNSPARVIPQRMILRVDTSAYMARCHNCGPASQQDSVSLHETDPTQPWAIWTVENYGFTYALKADNGKYLAICENCWDKASNPFGVFVSSDTPTGTALWWIGHTRQGYVFQNDVHRGNYLARCNQCVEGGVYGDFVFAPAGSDCWRMNTWEIQAV